MRGLAAALTGLALIAGAPVLAAPLVVTPSGKPEVVFATMTPAAAAGRIVAACGEEALPVVSNGPAEVVCGDPSVSVLRFAITAVGGDARVTGQAEIFEAAPAADVARRLERGGDRIQMMLLKAGGVAPEGASGGRPYLGLEGEDDGKGRWRVAKVNPGGAAATAGLKVGDVVTRLDGGKFRNFVDFARKLRTIQLGEAFTLTVLRGRETLDLPMTATSILGETTP